MPLTHPGSLHKYLLNLKSIVQCLHDNVDQYPAISSNNSTTNIPAVINTAAYRFLLDYVTKHSSPSTMPLELSRTVPLATLSTGTTAVVSPSKLTSA